MLGELASSSYDRQQLLTFRHLQLMLSLPFHRFGAAS